MTADNPIADLLAAPLGPHWTIEELAEQLLDAIASPPPHGAGEVEEFVLDAEALADRQSRRLFRPLSACLASKSAAEAGASPNLYEGRLAFKRSGHEGPVWIIGQFENKPGIARVTLRRAGSSPRTSEPTVLYPAAVADTEVGLDPRCP